MLKAPKVSVHGGHSGEFCNHASDSLEQIVLAYIDAGFSWVGVTEHMHAVSEEFVYPDEREAGLNAAKLKSRFGQYFAECTRLKEKYHDRIELLVAFEIESCSGSVAVIEHIIDTFKPDYIVGSVHHVSDFMIDYSRDEYDKAVRFHGGVEQLFCQYFDQQYEMIVRYKPSVVGHFDLIRLFDPDYLRTLSRPEVANRVNRNLEKVREFDLILDFNMAGFDKEGREPFPTKSILNQAAAMGIAIVPGDDSHGVSMVGRHYDKGIERLIEAGVGLDFRKPHRLNYEGRQR